MEDEQESASNGSDNDQVDFDAKSEESETSSGSADKNELFQTLKFSSDILDEMNNKRKSIVGASPAAADPDSVADTKKDMFDNLEQVRSNVKKGMVNIGKALPPANSATR